ncbi:MAG: NmrA family NAD(P)-binding protein [Deltaproteobacteria bacterium]|nr:NmrA family NAD(P)-binding protein [Deltaproteobacteria bacterium]
MKKVLVTSAAGFIGSHVVDELLKENAEVRALVRPGEEVRNIEGLEFMPTEDSLEKTVKWYREEVYVY